MSKKISKSFTFIENVKIIASVLGILYFLGWLIWAGAKAVSLWEKKDIADFAPFWEEVNSHPFIVAVGLICVIFLFIKIIEEDKRGLEKYPKKNLNHLD